MSIKEVMNLLKFGEKIKAYREKIGLTQKELAYKLGTSERMIIYIEKDNRYPSLPLLDRMRALFNCSFGDILD